MDKPVDLEAIEKRVASCAKTSKINDSTVFNRCRTSREDVPAMAREIRCLRERVKVLEEALTAISCIDGGRMGDFHAVEIIQLIAEAALRGEKGLE